MSLRDDEIAVRVMHSNFFVNECQQWIEIARASEDDPVINVLGPYHPTEIAEVKEHLAKIAGASDDIARLVAIE